MQQISEIISSGSAAMGISLDTEALNRFELFTTELVEWNNVMNLTAIKEPDQIAVKHYVDSISLLHYIKVENGAALADVGCGAGFPGIPLKIARPDIKLTCIDSLNKRVGFMRQLLDKLGFNDAVCLHARAEEAGRQKEYREKYDIATARAVARLNLLCEYCLPLVKTGGIFAAMKAGGVDEETAEAEGAAAQCGGKIEAVHEFTLPDTDMARTIIIVRKIKSTPEKYPRPSAKIAKAPL